MPRLNIGKRPVPNRQQTTNGWQWPRCFLAPRAQLGIRARVVQRFSFRAISATTSKTPSMSKEPEVIFERRQAAFPQPRDASSDRAVIQAPDRGGGFMRYELASQEVATSFTRNWPLSPARFIPKAAESGGLFRYWECQTMYLCCNANR